MTDLSPIAKTAHPSLSGRLALLLGLAALGCGVDLATKELAFSTLGLPPSQIAWIVKGFFGFETSINTGALFGMGQGHVAMLAAISVLAIVAILVWFIRTRALNDLLVTVALGMILGGITGNLYDRLGFWGYHGVRDWILFRFGSFTWPNFNIADSLLVVGAGLLMGYSFRHEGARSQVESETAA